MTTNYHTANDQTFEPYRIVWYGNGVILLRNKYQKRDIEISNTVPLKHSLGRQSTKYILAKLANFHGPIMRLKLGQIHTVVFFFFKHWPSKCYKSKTQPSLAASRTIPHPVRPNEKFTQRSHTISVDKLDASHHFRYLKLCDHLKVEIGYIDSNWSFYYI